MSRHRRRLAAALLAFAAASTVRPAAVQEHHHHETEALGSVRFPVTCRKDVRVPFSRAVALLHSFGYEEARLAFEAIARQDQQCGMAYWGIAMTYYHPIWAPPTEAEFSAGRAAAQTASRLEAQSERERRYIAAIGTFYLAPDAHDTGARARAYKAAMQSLAAEFPDDTEAQIFYALALLGSAPPADTTFSHQKQAAALLERLLPANPEHPGILHYLIHAFDYPRLASLALPAARAYAKVAPASPHALHMPSHIFTRLGLWDESIASNLASAAAAKAQVARTHPGAASFDALHALDYLTYAYLQIGDDAKARAVVAEVERASRFDDPNFAAGYAIAAAPARYALERHDWRAAAALEPPAVDLPWDRFPYARASTWFARAVGAARSGNLPRAREAIEELRAIRDALVANRPAGPYDWAEQVDALRLASEGWAAFAGGRPDEAARLLTEAAALEKKVGKHPVTPGAILPAAELLGDLLIELKRPREARAAYEASLAEAPNRFNAVAGAARAAEAAGDRAAAARYYRQLVALCHTPCARPEVRRAETFLTAR
ncbi:MAG TPA: hypothetical protein VNI83_05980 [Vicinamibacterales bacterium]|nr:hypothetical protein [Vicinamibacterales bacterium]